MNPVIVADVEFVMDSFKKFFPEVETHAKSISGR
jgi:hypothetical protein